MKNNKKFVYPGSFDPFTRGHLDIAVRAAELCENLDVVILNNSGKQSSFTIEERVHMAELSLDKYANIRVSSFDGLLVEYLQKHNCNVVVRGLRTESDFRYELQMASTNKLMYEDYETILIPSIVDYSHTSSSTVKEVAQFGGDISKMVPNEILDIIMNKFKK